MCVCVCVRQSADAEVVLERGASVRLVTAEEDRDKTDGSVIWMDYPSMPRVLKTGSRVFIDDGLLALKVLEIGTADEHQLMFRTNIKCLDVNRRMFSF